jgi:hypothetical protein
VLRLRHDSLLITGLFPGVLVELAYGVLEKRFSADFIGRDELVEPRISLGVALGGGRGMGSAHHFDGGGAIFLFLLSRIHIVETSPRSSALRVERRYRFFVSVSLKIGDVHARILGSETSLSVIYSRRSLCQIMVARAKKIETLFLTYLAIMYGETSGGHVIFLHEGPYDTEWRWEELPAVLKLLIYRYGLYRVEEKLGARLCTLIDLLKDRTG